MLVWLMQNSELHAVHGTASVAPAEMASGDEFRMEMLMREMEDMVVENKLKGEVGPMRSAWDRAVERRRVRTRSVSL